MGAVLRGALASSGCCLREKCGPGWLAAEVLIDVTDRRMAGYRIIRGDGVAAVVSAVVARAAGTEQAKAAEISFSVAANSDEFCSCCVFRCAISAPPRPHEFSTTVEPPACIAARRSKGP